MTSVLEEIEGKMDCYQDIGWQYHLENVLDRAKGQNFYEIMGIKCGEAIDGTKLAKTFKRLGKWLHPDKNLGKPYAHVAEELFKLVSNAKDTLIDPKAEEDYRDSLSRPSRHAEPSAAPSRHEDRRASSGSSTQTFTFFNGRLVPPEEPKIIERDVLASERVETRDGNILVKGNVYGTVSSMSGQITVEGFVEGEVFNMSGGNIIYSGIKARGKVTSMNGNNQINGEILGTYSTRKGLNIINGVAYAPPESASDDSFSFSVSFR